jgi:hypothetical protein
MEQEIDWEQELYGGGYKQLDRERDEGRKKDFWAALDGMSSGVGLMVDWVFIFGSAVNVVRPFLEVTGQRTETFPCPAVTPCGCRHTISETIRGELIASCGCDWDCGTYQIEPADILFHGINMDRFCGAIRRALGFAVPSAAAYASAGLREIGTYAAAAVPVYFSMEGRDDLLRELTKLLGVRDGPFLVLTPTGRSWSAEVEALARPHAGGHVALASVLAQCRVENEECRVGEATSPRPSPPAERGLARWEFRAKAGMEPMLADFGRRLARGNGMAHTVQEIGRNLDAIAKGSYELRKENSELRRLQSDGMFKFALRVEPEDFQAFAAIIALGNRKAAAEFLGVPLRSFYDRIERWPGKGADYARMFRMLEWRKATDRKMVVRLEDSLLSSGTGDAAENPETLGAVLAAMKDRDGGGYPDFLRQVLEALREQNAGNWGGVRDELVGILKEEVPQ